MKQTNEHLTVIEVFQRIKTARETVGKNCITDWYITNGGLIETPQSANTYIVVFSLVESFDYGNDFVKKFLDLFDCDEWYFSYIEKKPALNLIIREEPL